MISLKAGLMKDNGQPVRDSENFAGPVDFEKIVVFQNLQAHQNIHWPWPVGRGLS